MKKTLTVSEAARELGRSERWLRSAEVTGKIPRARRDINGWRVYTSDDVSELRRLILPDRPDSETEAHVCHNQRLA